MEKNLFGFRLLSAILSIALGIYMFTRPLATLASFSILFAILSLINGISEIIAYFTRKYERRNLQLLDGIVDIIISILLFTSSWNGLVAFIPSLLGLWFLMFEVTRLMLSFPVMKVSKEFGRRMMLMGILGIITALLVFMNPLFTGVTLIYIIAIALVYQGASMLYLLLIKRQGA